MPALLPVTFTPPCHLHPCHVHSCHLHPIAAGISCRVRPAICTPMPPASPAACTLPFAPHRRPHLMPRVPCHLHPIAAALPCGVHPASCTTLPFAPPPRPAFWPYATPAIRTSTTTVSTRPHHPTTAICTLPCMFKVAQSKRQPRGPILVQASSSTFPIPITGRTCKEVPSLALTIPGPRATTRPSRQAPPGQCPAPQAGQV